MSSTSRARTREPSTSTMVAFATSGFAATMLILVGLFQVLQGIAAVVQDEVFVSGARYVYALDVTAWGWIHVIVGALAVVTGIGVYMSQSWAYVTGIVIAVVSGLTNFAFLPYYPVWSVVVLAFNVAVIWALTTLLTRDDVPR